MMAPDDLSQTHDFYKKLLNKINIAYFLVQVILDERNKPVYAQIIEANAKAIKIAGMPLAGKLITELSINQKTKWLDFLGRVALSETSKIHEHDFSVRGNSYYRVHAFKAGSSADGKVVLILEETIQRMHSDEAMQNNEQVESKLSNFIDEDVSVSEPPKHKPGEKNKGFLLKLSDTFRTLSDWKIIEETGSRMLADFLKLDRAYVFVLYPADDRAVVRAEYRKENLFSMIGEVRMSDFPETVQQIEDETIVFNDIDSDSRLSDLNRTSLRTVNLQSFMCASVRKGEGNILWSFAAAVAVPRIWTDSEVALIESVAERIWAAAEQAKAEATLQHSKKGFESIANLVPDLLWDSEPDGSTNWYNQRWLEYTGQTFEQAIGWGWVDTIHPDDRDASAKRYAEAVKVGKPLQQENRIRRHDGEYRWFMINALPVYNDDGQVIKMYGAAIDIHDRKMAEQQLQHFNLRLEKEVKERTAELQQSRDKLQSILDTTLIQMSILEAVRSDDGTVTDFIITSVNKELERVTGRTDLVGKLYTQEYPGVKEVGIFNLIVKTVRTGEPQQMEYYYAQEGFTNWFSCMFVKLADGVVATNMDITAGKKAEERIRKMEAEQQLEVFRVSLQTVEEERQRISESLHNGIGQMLYGIKLSLNIINLNINIDDFEKAKKYTNKLLTDAIVETRRISHELMPTTLQEFGLKSAVADTCRQLSESVKFSCQISGLHGRLEKYLELAVYRTVQELMTNVVKHARATAATVQIRVEKHGIKIVVSDNGQGMDAMPKQKSGIGLSSIRSKIKLLNGEVNIMSAAGKGTTVAVNIPVQGR